jgi:tetratricopeptide (TPR) repeat protein
LRCKKYKLALSVFEDLIKKYPENLNDEIFNNYAWANYKTRKYQKAIECSLKAVELNPKFKEAWDTLGCSYYQEKMYNEAQKAFEKSELIDPTYKGTQKIRKEVRSILRKPDSSLSVSIEKKAYDLSKKFANIIPLKLISNELNLPISSVYRALEKSKTGKVLTYDSSDIAIFAFLLYDSQTTEKKQITRKTPIKGETL